MAKTTIQIERQTRELLSGHRIAKRESYDEVLRRLMIGKARKSKLKASLTNPLNTGQFKSVQNSAAGKQIKRQFGI